jgi:hypothetical protein
MDNNILIQAVAAAMVVKILVDAVKMTPLQTVGWKVVLLAFVFGQLCAAAFKMTTDAGLALTQKDLSGCFLVGVLAFGSAIGVTELQKKAEERKEGY